VPGEGRHKSALGGGGMPTGARRSWPTAPHEAWWLL
jgi:hypothetical protein